MDDGIITNVASGIATALATLCVTLRFYTRWYTKAGVAWDDWLMLIGLLSLLSAGAIVLWGNSADPYGGQEVDALSASSSLTFDYVPHMLFLKLSWISSIFYFTIIGTTKISILLMYWRMFSIDAAFRIQSITLGIFICLFWLSTTIACIVNCMPFEYNWVGLTLEPYCINFNIFWVATGVIEVLIDSFTLTLPVRLVLGLQLSAKSKISVVLIFLLGGFVIITGILRIIYGYVPGRRYPSYTKAELWSSIHLTMAIICGCLPPLVPLYSRITSYISSLSLLNRASSFMRRHFKGLRGLYAKSNSVSESSSSRESRITDTNDWLPLSRQDLSKGAKYPSVEMVWLSTSRETYGKVDR